VKTIAGAVVVLAGAVLLAGGTLADALMQAANRNGSPGGLITALGIGVGLVGFALLAVGWHAGADRTDSPASSPAPEELGPR